jgi:hypothetical protein
MAGGRDARAHIRSGHQKLLRAGLNSRYLELPGARHGQYGPHALRVMSDGLRWVVHAPQPAPNANSGAAPQPESHRQTLHSRATSLDSRVQARSFVPPPIS